MPYKNAEQAVAASKGRMRRHRNPVTPDVTPDVTPRQQAAARDEERQPEAIEQGWRDLESYIQRAGPAMPNLERIQRIAGSLGPNADAVQFGITGITVQDIGTTIGTQPAKYALK